MRGNVVRSSAPVTYAPGPRTAYPTVAGSQPAYRVPSRPANAWSGTAVESTGNTGLRGNSLLPLYGSNGYTNNRFAGQHLDPGAPGANLPSNRFASNGSRYGRYRSSSRYYNYPYAYGPAYAPYIGYYGGYDSAYPYYTDGLSADAVGGYNNGTPAVTPQYSDQGQDSNGGQPAPAPQPPARDQAPNTGVQGTVPNNGPDSLVEAVQQELIRRGYFAGKVDAMYGPDTKDALRKFQEDHHLADSGLINEATLHALQLD